MKKDLNISKRAFWDTDISKLDKEAHKVFIIRRVFEQGKWDDIINTIVYYGDDTVINALLSAEYLPENALHLASVIFKIKKDNFKCYTNKPYRPSLKKL